MTRITGLFCAGILVGGIAVGGLASASDPKLDGTRPLTDPLVCLARTIYFEARGQSDRGMTAVGYVVVNRARHSDYPDDICAVVREGGETPPCQFSWWCDGRSDVAVERREYDRAVRIARGIIGGNLPDPTGGANMFHNRWASPPWADEAEDRGRIDDQHFYFLEDR